MHGAVHGHLDATIVNVALPSIQTDLTMSDADLQWIVNAYTLTFGGFLLLGGRAGDLVGRKRIFLVGVVIFTVASLLNGLATTSEILIVCRGLQGLGAALVAPAALSIITTTFAEGAERTKAMGVWAAIAVGGGAVGLVLGGILTTSLSWPWIFFVNVPVGIAVFIVSLRLVPESRDAQAHKSFDVAGAVTVTAGLLTLVYGIVKAQEKGWTSLHTGGFFALAIVLLAAFIVIERRSAEPLVRLSIFRVPSGIPNDDAGLASGLFNTSQQVGGALGLAVLATLAIGATDETLAGVGGEPQPADQAQALVDGFHVAYLGSALLVAAGAVLLLVLLRRQDVVVVGEGKLEPSPA